MTEPTWSDQTEAYRAAHPEQTVDRPDPIPTPVDPDEGGTRVTIAADDHGGDVIVTRVERVIVEQAPERSRIGLGVLQASDPRLLFVSAGRLYIGEDRHGADVVYRVTGWDPGSSSLLIERERS